MVCEEHRNDLVHCCDNKNLVNTAIIICEHCLQWYHMKCQEVGSNLSEMSEFKCSNCTKWHAKIESDFKPVLESEINVLLAPAPGEEEYNTLEGW